MLCSKPVRGRRGALCAIYGFTKVKAGNGPLLEEQDLRVRPGGWSLAGMHVWNGSNWHETDMAAVFSVNRRGLAPQSAPKADPTPRIISAATHSRIWRCTGLIPSSIMLPEH